MHRILKYSLVCHFIFKEICLLSKKLMPKKVKNCSHLFKQNFQTAITILYVQYKIEKTHSSAPK